MKGRARIVKTGDSRGIRIPKMLLDEADLPEEVELRALPGRLVIQAVRRSRRVVGGGSKTHADLQR